MELTRVKPVAERGYLVIFNKYMSRFDIYKEEIITWIVSR
jgi:hypothetical protein